MRIIRQQQDFDCEHINALWGPLYVNAGIFAHNAAYSILDRVPGVFAKRGKIIVTVEHFDKRHKEEAQVFKATDLIGLRRSGDSSSIRIFIKESVKRILKPVKQVCRTFQGDTFYCKTGKIIVTVKYLEEACE